MQTGVFAYDPKPKPPPDVISQQIKYNPYSRRIVTASTLEPPRKKARFDDRIFTSTDCANDANSTSELLSPKKLVARSYQQELFEECLQHNVIAVAPTGAGKTLIAVLLVQHALQTDTSRKVLFLVNQVPLVLQQANVFKELLEPPFNENIGMLHGDRSAKDWPSILQNYHVIVCTVQLFVNAIQRGDAKLEDVQLIIFDECHHARNKHPFRVIMTEHYLPAKRQGRTVPKILGLSASPAAKNTTAETLLGLVKLCHDMDCRVRKVEKHVAELQQAISLPSIIQRSIPLDSKSNELRILLYTCMNKIKDVMIEKMNVHESIDSNNQDSTKWDEWIHNIMIDNFGELKTSELLDQQDQDNTSFPKSTSHVLLLAQTIAVLNECVMVIDNRSSDAAWKKLTSYLQNTDAFITNILDSINVNGHRYPANYFPQHCQKRFLLLEILKEYKDVKVLIFVKTRIGAQELAEFLQENGFTMVGVLLGHGDRALHGMSSTKQQSILEEFKQGLTNILVATSVAEEGLDVTSCKLVIRMDGIDTALQLIQSRGRARSSNSEFMFLHHTQSTEAKKVVQCLTLESKMLRAIDILCKAEQTIQDVYLHESSDDNVTIGHLFEFIWNYEVPIVHDELTNQIYNQIDTNRIVSVLENTCIKLLGVSPEYEIYKLGNDHKPEFLGYVTIHIPNHQQGARKVVFTAEKTCNVASSAKVAAAKRVLDEFHKHDLIIHSNNRYREEVKENETTPKKKTRNKQTTLINNENRSIITSLNAVSILLYVCPNSYGGDPVFQPLRTRESTRNHYGGTIVGYTFECRLPDSSIIVKSNTFDRKQEAKNDAALRMCNAIIDKHGFLEISQGFITPKATEKKQKVKPPIIDIK